LGRREQAIERAETRRILRHRHRAHHRQPIRR
jgi:hypothetical protein